MGFFFFFGINTQHIQLTLFSKSRTSLFLLPPGEIWYLLPDQNLTRIPLGSGSRLLCCGYFVEINLYNRWLFMYGFLHLIVSRFLCGIICISTLFLSVSSIPLQDISYPVYPSTGWWTFDLGQCLAYYKLWYKHLYTVFGGSVDRYFWFAVTHHGYGFLSSYQMFFQCTCPILFFHQKWVSPSCHHLLLSFILS